MNSEMQIVGIQGSTCVGDVKRFKWIQKHCFLFLFFKILFCLTLAVCFICMLYVSVVYYRSMFHGP